VQWNYLKQLDNVSSADARFCDRCNRVVHAVKDEKDLKKMYERGNCVAVVAPLVDLDDTRRGDGFLIGIL
jgi:hypothetical protein